MGLLDRPIAKAINKYLENNDEVLLKTPKDAYELAVYIDQEWYQKLFKVLYIGNMDNIIRFFKTVLPRKYPFIRLNYFWRIQHPKLNMLHYDLPNIVSKTMANVLFSNPPSIKLSDETSTKELADILNENQFDSLLQKSAEYESYSGKIAFKPIIDKSFSQYPLLMVYPSEDFEVIKRYDKPYEIIFRDIYDKGNNARYVLFTHCKRGKIEYKLFSGNSDANMKEVPLDTIDETSGLQDITFYYENGKAYDKIPCLYKENNGNGISDYMHIVDDCSAIDEVYTNLVDFIRKARIKTYIPESFLKEDTKGNRLLSTDYDTDEMVLYDALPEGTTQEAKRDVVKLDDSIQGYKDAFNNILARTLSTVGLSPATIGMHDDSGSNESALALSIREGTTLRTREAKIKKWNQTLKDMAILLLQLYKCNIGNDGAVYLKEYDANDIEIIFPKYESGSYLERVQTLKEALDAGLISKELALKDLYPALSDKSIEDLLADIDKDDLQKLINSIDINPPKKDGDMNESAGIEDKT